MFNSLYAINVADIVAIYANKKTCSFFINFEKGASNCIQSSKGGDNGKA